jgi:hypothetical protein
LPLSRWPQLNFSVKICSRDGSCVFLQITGELDGMLAVRQREHAAREKAI